jgi:glycosyltransferase involved in cell wall biosynthesis
MHGNRLVQRLLDFYNSKVDLVIVTNDGHARYLGARGCRTYVCPDPLPCLKVPDSVIVTPAKSVFLVCSFDDDEPYEAAFAAFSRLKESGFVLFVSGNYRKARIEPSDYPWVHFLGFMPDDEYYAYLRACSVVIDLTTLEDCLVCGAYEALALEKPLVLSRTRALEDYFGAAAVLTNNTPDSITESIHLAHSQRHQLAGRARDWIVVNEQLIGRLVSELRAELSWFREPLADRSRRSATS